MSSPRATIFIDPPSHHFLEDRLFEPTTNPLSGDNILAPYIAVRDYFTRRGIPVHTSDLLGDVEVGEQNFYFSIGRLEDLDVFEARSDTIISSYFAMECPIVDPGLFRSLPGIEGRFQRIYSWSDGPSLEPFVGKVLNCELFRWPQSRDAVHEEFWSRGDRGFLMMMNSNKFPALYHNELYSERIRAIEFFNRTGEIDLYGPYWTKAPWHLAKNRIPHTFKMLMRYAWEIRQKIFPNPIYTACAEANRGIAKSKLGTMSRYKFAICFENMILKGWTTEKIFDCMFAGTIPVYWGDPDIQDKVPSDCYVDYREFMSYPKLRDFLHSLTPDEIDKYRLAAKDFIASERYDPFRIEAFVALFSNALERDAGITV